MATFFMSRSRGVVMRCGSSRFDGPVERKHSYGYQKMTAAEIKARPSKRSRAKIDATTEENIRRQMIEDGENPDEELSAEDVVSPWFIRKGLGMSQREFADTLGVPLATLRNWEQNRVAMEPATIALMRILAREPKAALRALRRRAA
jgi:putative transcriptional regulator